jgi:hypothetical protein
VTTAYGTAVTLVSGSGSRVYTNRFGATVTSSLTIAPVGTLTSNNLLYLGNPYPVDSNGITWTLSAPVQLPGQAPTILYSQIQVYNQSGILVEGGASRIDGLGSAFLSSIPGFVNLTVGASNINALAVNYGTCQAPLSFTNGLRAPTQPSVSNGAQRFSYSYFISDGVSYSVQGNLVISTASAFATLHDQLGNPYQQVTNVTGTRLYTFLPTGQQLTSTVNGLSLAAISYADQRFYPYSLLGSAPGVYSMNTAPFFDFAGVEFNVSPPVPVNGVAPGVGPQYTATSLYFSTPEPTAVLTDGNIQPTLTYTHYPCPTSSCPTHLLCAVVLFLQRLLHQPTLDQPSTADVYTVRGCRAV